MKNQQMGNSIKDVWINSQLGDEIQLLYGKSLPKQLRAFGNVPVFGSNGIVGQHSAALVKGPGIIVGRKGSCGEVHYSEKDFWPIDTTYYVIPKKEHNLRFLYFYLKRLGLNTMNSHSTIPGLNRDLVYKLDCEIPPYSEQLTIAAVLFKIQKAIEVQESIIEKTRELKKSTLHHVFTYGLLKEKLKETEIGPIPESWLIRKIGDLGKIVTGTTPPTKYKEYYQGGHYQFIAPNDIGKTTRIYKTEKRITDKGLEVSRLLPKESVCFVCIGSTIGKVGITVEEKATTNQQINSVIVNHDCDPYFVTYLMDYKSEYIASFSSPSPVPILSKGKFEEISIMLSPDIAEQREIARVLMAIDETIEINTAKKSALQDLFKTILNKLMTVEIRVKDLDIDISEVSA